MRGFRPMVASILVLFGCTKLAGIDGDYTLEAGGSDAGEPDASTGVSRTVDRVASDGVVDPMVDPAG